MANGEEAFEEIVSQSTNPYRILHEMRHQAFDLFTTEDRLRVRRVLWVMLNGFAALPAAPRSDIVFNTRYRNYLNLPPPIPMPPLVANIVPGPFMENVSEIVFDGEEVVRIVDGWNGTILRKIVNYDEARPAEIRGGDNMTSTAKAFISAVRRLVCILKDLKVRGSRFIRVAAALEYFVPHRVPLVPRNDWGLFENHAHKVTPEELWAAVLQAGHPQQATLRLNRWDAITPQGGVIGFFNVEE